MTPFLLLVLHWAFSSTAPVLDKRPFFEPSADAGEVAYAIQSRPSLQTAADTIRAGDVYVTNLPDSLFGELVVRYSGIALPGRSWLLDRSFFWKTADPDRGDHELWFRAFLSGERVDSLSIRITVE